MSASSSVAHVNVLYQFVSYSVSSARVSSTPSIEVDDTGLSRDDSDGEEKELNPKKKVYADGEEVVNISEG